jgi:hypothetical protein
LTTVHTVKSKRKISQNFVAFSEYMNFTRNRFSFKNELNQYFKQFKTPTKFFAE